MALHSQCTSHKLCFQYHIYHYSTNVHPIIDSAASNESWTSQKSKTALLISHLSLIQKLMFDAMLMS